MIGDYEHGKIGDGNVPVQRVISPADFFSGILYFPRNRVHYEQP